MLSTQELLDVTDPEESGISPDKIPAWVSVRTIVDWAVWYNGLFWCSDKFIVVDEPFCKNAVHMLAIMQGFVVKSRQRNRMREYIVSLL